MDLYIISIFIAVQVDYGVSQAFKNGDTRMDDNSWYIIYQDIVKAIENSQPPWLYGYSYEPSTVENGKVPESFLKDKEGCIYFRRITNNKTDVHFQEHKPKKPKEQKQAGTQEEQEKVKERQDALQPEDDKEEVKDYYGKLFNTSIKNDISKDDVRKSTSNAITITEIPGAKEGKSFKLLYSDYKHCSIWRPFTPPPEGQTAIGKDQSYNKTKAHCVLLLSDWAARNEYPSGQEPPGLPRWMNKMPEDMPENLPDGMPKWCQLIYRNLCGIKAKLIQVFHKDCPKIPNALGC